MGRWSNTAPAPDVVDALRDAGLPVQSCHRQTHPPHHVRAHFARKLSQKEKDLASKVKAAVKSGAYKKKQAVTRPVQNKTHHGRPGRTMRSTNAGSPVEIAGMRAMVVSLIRQAFDDARASPNNVSGPQSLDIHHARLFLTAETGEWAHAREMWCLIADIDPDAIKQAAHRHLQDGHAIIFPRKSGRRARGS